MLRSISLSQVAVWLDDADDFNVSTIRTTEYPVHVCVRESDNANLDRGLGLRYRSATNHHDDTDQDVDATNFH